MRRRIPPELVPWLRTLKTSGQAASRGYAKKVLNPELAQAILQTQPQVLNIPGLWEENKKKEEKKKVQLQSPEINLQKENIDQIRKWYRQVTKGSTIADYLGQDVVAKDKPGGNNA